MCVLKNTDVFVKRY